MATCFAGPAVSSAFRYVDEVTQILWHYGADVWKAPTERINMEKRLETGTTLIGATREAVNIPFLLYEEDREDVEAKFAELEKSMDQLKTFVSASDVRLKSLGRFSWPIRQRKVEEKLIVIEKDVDRVLEYSKLYYLIILRK